MTTLLRSRDPPLHHNVLCPLQHTGFIAIAWNQLVDVRSSMQLTTRIKHIAGQSYRVMRVYGSQSKIEAKVMWINTAMETHNPVLQGLCFIENI
jgi:hypothetical protein